MKYRIKEIREKKGISQEQLAAKSKISRGTISKLETNEEPEALVGTLNAIAEALNVPVRKLFN